MSEAPKLKRELGFFATVAIIIGQMIGSGIYMTPQGLAELSNAKMGICSVAVTGVGTLLLALSFARLAQRKAVTGSAVVYTNEAFGELPAFWVGWSYWCGCWTANGAIIIAGVNYLSYFFPVFAADSIQKFALSLVVIWLFTLLNIKGVKEAGYLNLVLTAVKLLPLLIFIVIAAQHVEPANFETVSSPDLQGVSVLPVAMAYSLWCYIGFEGATVNAGEVKETRYVYKATIFSTIAVILIYVTLTFLAAGNMSQSELAVSASPFADIIQAKTGYYWAGGLISIGGFFSAFGCVGAWILSAARVSYSLGETGLLPKTFGEIDPKRGTPVNSLIINCILMTIIMIIGFVTKSGSVYTFFVMLSVLSFLVFYAFGAASEIMLSGRDIKSFNLVRFIKKTWISFIALAYSIYTIVGAGADYVMYGFLLLLLGIPVFIYVKLSSDAEAKK